MNRTVFEANEKLFNPRGLRAVFNPKRAVHFESHHSYMQPMLRIEENVAIPYASPFPVYPVFQNTYQVPPPTYQVVSGQPPAYQQQYPTVKLID